jgi:hypothetical protein
VLVLIPSHTSDQASPLDLVFSLHKLEFHRVHPHTDLAVSTVKILKILNMDRVFKSLLSISMPMKCEEV